MKTRALAAALLAVVFTSGCASTLCKKAEDVVATRVSDVISEKLACENNFAVQMDVLAKIQEQNFCGKKNMPEGSAIQGPIADAVCPAVGLWAASFVSTKTPAEWKCSRNPALVPIASDVERVCKFIPFAPKKAGGK